MGTAEFKRIGNVSQFIEAQRMHAQALQQGGFVFTDPIPAALKPLTQSLGPWQGSNDMAWDFLHPDSEGKAVGANERADIGGFEAYQIVAKPWNVEHAGHTYRVNPKVDFLYGGMSMQIAREKITKPVREWNHAAAKEMLDVFTSGAFSAASAARTEGYVWRLTDFRGREVVAPAVTESANEATPTVAHSAHLVRWPDKQGGRFAAGHDHVPANFGGVWTEAAGKTARDHILEHPGNNRVGCYVGANVVDDIEAHIETVRTNTESGVTFEKEGATEDEFGTPTYIGRHDAVDYWRLDCLPDDIGVYFAIGKKPLAFSVGVQRADGDALPYSWNTKPDEETEAVSYGYRGVAYGLVKDPTAIYIDRYTA